MSDVYLGSIQATYERLSRSEFSKALPPQLLEEATRTIDNTGGEIRRTASAASRGPLNANNDVGTQKPSYKDILKHFAPSLIGHLVALALFFLHRYYITSAALTLSILARCLSLASHHREFGLSTLSSSVSSKQPKLRDDHAPADDQRQKQSQPMKIASLKRISSDLDAQSGFSAPCEASQADRLMGVLRSMETSLADTLGALEKTYQSSLPYQRPGIADAYLAGKFCGTVLTLKHYLRSVQFMGSVLKSATSTRHIAAPHQSGLTST